MRIVGDFIISELFRRHVLPKSREGAFNNKLTVSGLFKDIEACSISGKKDLTVSSLAFDSRKVVPGALFFAIPGMKEDGAKYIVEAIEHGAAGIVAETHCEVVPEDTCLIAVKSIRKVMASVARHFYGFPDKSLNVVGVTGTNGKTTVTIMSQFLLKEPNQLVGSLGTLGYDLGGKTLPSCRATPESIDLHGMFAQMLNFECKTAIMEVTSHGLSLNRVADVDFDIAVFLNLTQDHLDFHGSMEAYYGDKKQLFSGKQGRLPRMAIINIDDRYGQRLVQEIPEEVPIITFGMNENAMVRAENIHLTDQGVSFNLIYQEGVVVVESSLLGRYNISNILAAMTIAWQKGGDMVALACKLKDFKGVPGRMERIFQGQPYNVLVDYAHTDDALNNALKMLREVTEGRLFVVFGCGGDRDKKKRPLMTAAVQKWADYAWATADNPRTESQFSIFEGMKLGVSNPEKISFIPERRRAIDLALEAAQPGDCVLIAGKGHENYQIVGDSILPFDDKEVTSELLSLKLAKKLAS